MTMRSSLSCEGSGPSAISRKPVSIGRNQWLVIASINACFEG
jgi:hypothetical protein